VIVQTYAPDHPAIAAVARHDYEGFVRDELAERRTADYPPFARMIALRLDARDAAEARAGAQAAAEAARAAGGPAVTVRGPAEAPLSRLRGRTRWQVWLSSHDRSRLVAAARAASAAARSGKGGGADLRFSVDVDPQSAL
jgi:primosomal protein N' (replication factor Y)